MKEVYGVNCDLHVCIQDFLKPGDHIVGNLYDVIYTTTWVDGEVSPSDGQLGVQVSFDTEFEFLTVCPTASAMLTLQSGWIMYHKPLTYLLLCSVDLFCSIFVSVLSELHHRYDAWSCKQSGHIQQINPLWLWQSGMGGHSHLIESKMLS